jgi:hypothetical protein
MTRQIVGWAFAVALCLSASVVYGQQREKEAKKKPGNEPQGQASMQHKPEPAGASQEATSAPGGDWSARTHSGKQSGTQSSNQQTQPGATGATAASAAEKNKSTQPTGAQGAAAANAVNKNQTPQVTGAQGAAAGAAVANRNAPPISGAAGAAAGAAAVNRNSPPVSGAEGAAVGAAVANNNQPQYSGAQGAAVGAALANSNNQSQYSGAQGAAAGAALANSNQPQYSGATGIVPGGAMTGGSQLQNGGAQAASAGPDANRNMPPAMGTASAVAGYEAVRNSFNASNVYRPQWWRDHPETWVPAGWIAGAAWHATPWQGIASFCGYGNAAPISYNYGVNVTAQNGYVFVDGQNVGSTGDYSLQAAQIAQAGAAAVVSPTDQWMPLGVFAMVRDEQQHPQLIVQLAIDKQGILRGNYIDELTESTLPIRGAVDSASKRAAWMVGNNKQTVMEAGLSDLTDPETPALVHKNGKTDHWILVRLDQPK